MREEEKERNPFLAGLVKKTEQQQQQTNPFLEGLEKLPRRQPVQLPEPPAPPPEPEPEPGFLERIGARIAQLPREPRVPEEVYHRQRATYQPPPPTPDTMQQLLGALARHAPAVRPVEEITRARVPVEPAEPDLDAIRRRGVEVPPIPRPVPPPEIAEAPAPVPAPPEVAPVLRGREAVDPTLIQERIDQVFAPGQEKTAIDYIGEGFEWMGRGIIRGVTLGAPGGQVGEWAMKEPETFAEKANLVAGEIAGRLPYYLVGYGILGKAVSAFGPAKTGIKVADLAREARAAAEAMPTAKTAAGRIIHRGLDSAGQTAARIGAISGSLQTAKEAVTREEGAMERIGEAVTSGMIAGVILGFAVGTIAQAYPEAKFAIHKIRAGKRIAPTKYMTSTEVEAEIGRLIKDGWQYDPARGTLFHPETKSASTIMVRYKGKEMNLTQLIKEHGTVPPDVTVAAAPGPVARPTVTPAPTPAAPAPAPGVPPTVRPTVPPVTPAPPPVTPAAPTAPPVPPVGAVPTPEVVPPAPVTPPVKEPWEMKRKDYVDWYAETWETEGVPGTKADTAWAWNNHKMLIEDALSKGKPVPPEVLADYPDLKPPVEPEVPPVKEPWNMTKEEFRLSQMIARENRYRETGQEQFAERTRRAIDAYQDPKEKEEILKSPHWKERFIEFDSLQKQLVEQALAEGKPVPTEVLAEYPDLKPPAPEEVVPEAPAVVEGVYYDDMGVRVKDTSFAKGVDAGIADVLEAINKAGYETIQSHSGLKEDYPGKAADRYTPDGYIAFMKADLTSGQIEELRAAAQKAGLAFHDDSDIFMQPAVTIRSGITKQGTPIDELLYKAGDKALEELGFKEEEIDATPSPVFPSSKIMRSPKTKDERWQEWLELRAKIKKEMIAAEGGNIDNEQIKERWDILAKTLSEVPEPEIVPAPTPEVAPVKEPWQMTQEEFFAQPHDPRDARFVGPQFHHDIVKEALEMGKPVPSEVLADYPDLKPEVKAKAPAEPKELWQMTASRHKKRAKTLPIMQIRAEIVEILMENRGFSRDGAVQYIDAAGGDTAVRDLHNAIVPQESVELALREGKPVPPEVLADYPDLKPAEPPVEPPAPPVTEPPVPPEVEPAQQTWDAMTEAERLKIAADEVGWAPRTASKISRQTWDELSPAARNVIQGRIEKPPEVAPEVAPTPKPADPVDVLIERFNAAGWTAHRYPRKKMISIAGKRAIPEKEAIKEMERLLAERPDVKPVEPTPPEVVPETPPVEAPPVEVPGLPEISIDDIPYQLAHDAYRGISFDPEKRAEQTQKEYIAHMQGVYDKFSLMAETPAQQALLKAELERYRDNYVKRYKGVLTARSRTLSPMITGPAKFPTARNEKALDAEARKVKEFLEWDEKAQRSIEKKLTAARPPEKIAAEEYKKLERRAAETIATLKGIEEGELPYSAPLFKSNLAELIKRSADRGNIEETKKVLEFIREEQKVLKAPVFTDRHSIWAYPDEAAKKVAVEAERTGTRPVATFEGVEVVSNYDVDRTQILFDVKPPEAVRADLKKQGWKWSPRESAWQRKLTGNAEWSAKSILGKHYEERVPEVVPEALPPVPDKLYRYYTTQRPPAPGAVPGGAKNVVAYDEKTKGAWGYVEYDKPLTAKQISDYELKPEVAPEVAPVEPEPVKPEVPEPPPKVETLPKDYNKALKQIEELTEVDAKWLADNLHDPIVMSAGQDMETVTKAIGAAIERRVKSPAYAVEKAIEARVPTPKPENATAETLDDVIKEYQDKIRELSEYRKELYQGLKVYRGLCEETGVSPAALTERLVGVYNKIESAQSTWADRITIATDAAEGKIDEYGDWDEGMSAWTTEREWETARKLFRTAEDAMTRKYSTIMQAVPKNRAKDLELMATERIGKSATFDRAVADKRVKTEGYEMAPGLLVAEHEKGKWAAFHKESGFMIPARETLKTRKQAALFALRLTQADWTKPIGEIRNNRDISKVVQAAQEGQQAVSTIPGVEAPLGYHLAKELYAEELLQGVFRYPEFPEFRIPRRIEAFFSKGDKVLAGEYEGKKFLSEAHLLDMTVTQVDIDKAVKKAGISKKDIMTPNIKSIMDGIEKGKFTHELRPEEAIVAKLLDKPGGRIAWKLPDDKQIFANTDFYNYFIGRGDRVLIDLKEEKPTMMVAHDKDDNLTGFFLGISSEKGEYEELAARVTGPPTKPDAADYAKKMERVKGDPYMEDDALVLPMKVPIGKTATFPPPRVKTAEVIKRRDLVHALADILETPIRTGRFRMPGAVGIFKTIPEIIRVKGRFAEDFRILTHEAGHKLDKHVLRIAETRDFDDEIRKIPYVKELMLKAKMKPDARLTPRLRKEGIAEFMMYWLLDPLALDVPGKGNLADKFPGLFGYFSRKMQTIPEIYDALLGWRELYQAYEAQPDEAAIMAAVNAPRKSQITPRQLLNKVNSALFDDLYQIAYFRDLLTDKMELPGRKDPYILARMARGSAGRAMLLVEDGQYEWQRVKPGETVDKRVPVAEVDGVKSKFVKVGPGLKEIMQEAGDELWEFTSYLISARAVELEAVDLPKLKQEARKKGLDRLPALLKWLDVAISKGQTNTQKFKDTMKQVEELTALMQRIEFLEGLKEREIISGMPIDKAKRVVDKYKDTEKFQKLKADLKGWSDHLIDDGVKAKMISPSQAAYLKKHEDYLPFARVRDDDEAIYASVGGTPRLGDLPKTVKKIYGSGRSILSPWEELARAAYQHSRINDFNRAMNALVDIAKKTEGMGHIIEKLPLPQRLTTFSLGQIMNVLEEAGVAAEDVTADTIAKVFTASARGIPAENSLIVMVDGRPELYRLHRDLYKSAMALDSEQLSWVFKQLNLFTRMLRRGAVSTMRFAWWSNPIRDTLWIGTFHKESRPVIDFGHGVAQTFGKGDWWKAYYHSGGALSAFTNYDEYADPSVSRFMKKTAKDYWKEFNPITLLAKMSQKTEEASKIGLFRRKLQKGEDIIDAAFGGREATVDYSVKGSMTKIMRAITPFFGAAMNSLRRIWVGFKKEPGGAFFRALMYITLPTLALYAINRNNPHYQEKSRQLKDVFWFIPLAGDEKGKYSTRFVMMPIPFSLGLIFKTLPERIAAKVADDDPRAFDEFAKTARDVALPNYAPAFLLPWLENWANINTFMGYPIVPQRERGLEPYLQYGPHSSEVSKAVGRALNVSPRHVDNIIFSYTATLGRYGVRAIDAGLDAIGLGDPVPKPEGGWRAIPVLGEVVSELGHGGSASIDQFYRDLEKAERKYRSIQTAQDLNRPLPKISEGDLLYLQALPTMRSLSRELAKMRTVVREVQASLLLTPGEKRLALDYMELEMINLIRGAYGKEPIPRD